MTEITVRFEDRDWRWDTDADVTVKQAITLHLAYAMTIEDWVEALKKFDARAWQFQYWLMLQHNAVIKPLQDCDFPMLAYAQAYYDAMEAAGLKPEEDGGPDPTIPPPPSPPDAPSSPGPSTPVTVIPAPVPQYAVPTAYSPNPYPGSGANTSGRSPISAT